MRTQSKKFLQIHTRLKEGNNEIKKLLQVYQEMVKEVQILHRNPQTRPIANDMAYKMREMKHSLDGLVKKVGEIVEVYGK